MTVNISEGSEGAALMHKVDVLYWGKIGHQGDKLPGVDGYYGLQTASGGKGPAATTASLQQGEQTPGGKRKILFIY